MLLELARSGLGIARLAQFHIQKDLESGSLVALLGEFEAGTPEAEEMRETRRRWVLIPHVRNAPPCR